jgi:DNA-binding Lrp family transcriptional regulator
LSEADKRIDGVDLQILKLLTLNSRTSYRSIGKTLGVSVNTVRSRINELILNKAIEHFVAQVNFSVFGYGQVLTILLKFNKYRPKGIENVVKSTSDLGPVYMHIEILDEVHVIGIAVKGLLIDNDNIDPLRKNISKALGRGISVLDVFFGNIKSLVSEKFRMNQIDFEIIECLLLDPRMTFLNIARKIGCSQKTIIRRIEKMESSHVITGFSLQYNPSRMRGYNYFSVLLRTRSNMAAEVMKEISYSDLNKNILTLPPFMFPDRVIIIFHIQNAFDIESIISKIRSIKCVIRAEAYQPIRIKWHEDWLKKKIKDRINSF